MHSAARRTIPERTLAPHSFFQSAIFTRVGCLPDPKSKNLCWSLGSWLLLQRVSESASLWRRFLVDCTIMCHQAEHRGKWLAFSNKNILYQSVSYPTVTFAKSPLSDAQAWLTPAHSPQVGLPHGLSRNNRKPHH